MSEATTASEAAATTAAAAGEPLPGADDRPWFIASRFQELEGEARANLLRILTVGVFYLVELVNWRGLDLGFIQFPKVPSVDGPFHSAITAVCIAWIAVAWAVSQCLRRRMLPAQLKYVSTGADAVLLTAILAIADAARSPLVVGYFLLIQLAALRLDLGLVRFTTAASLLGYGTLLAYARWYREELRTPRYHQLIFVVALALAGMFMGQLIRRVRVLAEDYSLRKQG